MQLEQKCDGFLRQRQESLHKYGAAAHGQQLKTNNKQAIIKSFSIQFNSIKSKFLNFKLQSIKSYQNKHNISENKCVRIVLSYLIIVLPSFWQCGQGLNFTGYMPTRLWFCRIVITKKKYKIVMNQRHLM